MRFHPLHLAALLLVIPETAMAGDPFQQSGTRTHGFHFLEGARAEIGSVSPDNGSSALVFGLTSSAGTLISPALDLTLGLRYWNADLDLEEASGSNGSLRDFSLQGNLNYHLMKIVGLRPYGLAGLGAHFVSADVPGNVDLADATGGFNFGFNLGIGVATAKEKGIGFRAEARREQAGDADNWNYTVGVGWWPRDKAVRSPQIASATTAAATTPATPTSTSGTLTYAEAAALQGTNERLTAENNSLRTQAGAGTATTPGATPVSTPEGRAAAQREAFQQMARLSGNPGGHSDTPQGPLFASESFVTFEEGASKLDAGDLNQVRRLAVLLLMFPGTTVKLEGHADSRGSIAANQKVTTARAMAVRQELLRLGVTSNAVTAVGIGSARPAVGDATLAVNRRVSVLVTGMAPK